MPRFLVYVDSFVTSLCVYLQACSNNINHKFETSFNCVGIYLFTILLTKGCKKNKKTCKLHNCLICEGLSSIDHPNLFTHFKLMCH